MHPVTHENPDDFMSLLQQQMGGHAAVHAARHCQHDSGHQCFALNK
jgi:hypothetical protein